MPNHKIYATCVVPLPDFSDLTLNAPKPAHAAPAQAVQPQIKPESYPRAPNPSKPALDLPSPAKPLIETRTLDRLEAQNQDLRDLLNKQSLVIIEARQLLTQLTRNLVVNNKHGVKQSLLDLNKTLGSYPPKFSNIIVKAKRTLDEIMTEGQ